MNLELNNSKNMIKHLNEMNKELHTQIKLKDDEIENIQKQINDNFTMKLRKDNERDHLTEIVLPNPYDKHPSKKRISRLSMSPMDRNNSTFTQFTNYVYSEQSAYSEVKDPNTIILNNYLAAHRHGINRSNHDSLQESFVSKRDDYGSALDRRKNSVGNEYRGEHRQAEVRPFNKNKEGTTGMPHNMTFGDANQQFRYKISEKKVNQGVTRREASAPNDQTTFSTWRGL